MPQLIVRKHLLQKDADELLKLVPLAAVVGEVDLSGSSFKRQLAVAADEPRAAAARAEERLRAAYDEMDRMRRDGKPPDTTSPELNDGFAATRPMRDGM